MLLGHVEWLNKHPREKSYLAHRIGGRKNRTQSFMFDWLNGGAAIYWTLGQYPNPTPLSTLLSDDSEGEHTLDITRLVFRQRRQNRGIGEWKVLSRNTRQQIRYPLVIRPLRLKSGHAVYGEVLGAEECHPLAPPDIWRTHRYEPWFALLNELLTGTGLWRLWAWHSIDEGVASIYGV